MRTLPILAVVSLFFCCAAAHAGQMNSAGYALRDSGTTNGGITSNSSSYQLLGTVRNEDGETGQGTLYALRGGLWQTPKAAVLYGDVNNDGIVDVADALRTLQNAVGLAIPTQQDWALGDIAPLVGGRPTPNGSIDVSDALVVLERVVGVVTW